MPERAAQTLIHVNSGPASHRGGFDGLKAGNAGDVLDRGLTGDDDRRRARFGIRGRERLEDTNAGAGIKRAGRLVAEQRIGFRAISVTSCTFSRAARLGTRLWIWKTKPKWSRR